MTMPEGGSVSKLIKDFRAGDGRAFEELWARYFDRLVAIASKQVAANGEDAALSAFHSFHRRASRGDFPNLDDRGDLWIQLMTLTRQKVIDSRRRENALKRGGGMKILRESDLATSDTQEDSANLAEIVGREPDPQYAAMMTEECRRLMDLLGDETLREIALLKMSLNTHTEIAAKFGRSLSWVNRKLDLIRTLWAEAAT